MLIKITNPEACKEITKLLRPSLRSIPVLIQIFNDATLLYWRNHTMTTVNVSIIQLNIHDNSLEVIFMGAHGVPYGPATIKMMTNFSYTYKN